MRPSVYGCAAAAGTGYSNGTLKCWQSVDPVVEGVAHGMDCMFIMVWGVVLTVWIGQPDVGMFLKVPSDVAEVWELGVERVNVPEEEL